MISYFYKYYRVFGHPAVPPRDPVKKYNYKKLDLSCFMLDPVAGPRDDSV
ncbi:MAG TPA: palindromic element RPE4 domain-containing protein [Rickettsia endosymbiont of Degeeriella rufa]|nr:palindromic element RPE4 domain-containing protein [Rickettsia endosymbiont of Degeeriella rufa]